MPAPILATKLYIPPARAGLVPRPPRIERLNAARKLVLVSAPAGFGKTTLVCEWVAGCRRPAAWLSLDEGDNDPARFLTCLVAALQTVAIRPPNFGEGVLRALQPSQPPNEAMLTALINEIAAIPDDFVLVLDDYHVIEAKAVDSLLAFLLGHLPPQMRLVIATREDPDLPLARRRAQGQLVELRVADLRFTLAEVAEFLNQVMGLGLPAEDITALETRTEGWIAGLHLAALALQGLAALGTTSTQGQQDAAGFIKSFTGSHHFVLDYLVEEVLQQQPESIQAFLLRTSILDRLCGPLCEAVLQGDENHPSDDDLHLPAPGFGQATLEYLEHANLFIVPLDGERRWYRYHHLFADLLRQRLQQIGAAAAREAGAAVARGQAEYHRRASQWYEDNGLEVEAFQHAAAANDIDRAAHLVEGKGMPLQFRGAVTLVLSWLASLPAAELDARPALWVMYASALSMTGQLAGVEPKLQAAEAALEAALHGAEPDARTRNLIGHIAAIRALLAAAQYQVEAIIAQSQRALEYLDPNNLPVRTATIWKLGLAYQFQGERAAASRAFSEAMAISQPSGNIIIHTCAMNGLGNIQETENQLYLAAETYRGVLHLAGDPPLSVASEAHFGLARICYEWNELDAAERHAQLSLQLAPQVQSMDRVVACEVFQARLKLARGAVSEAAAMLAQAGQMARQHNFVFRIMEIAATQVLALLRQGNLAPAAQLAQAHQLPLSQARVSLAQGDAPAALAVLGPLRQQMEARGWVDERLKVLVLQALAWQAQGQQDRALQVLGEALALAEPGGCVRIFVDEGAPMAQMLRRAAAQGMLPVYTGRLLAAFPAQGPMRTDQPATQRATHPPGEPLSSRELEILRLIAQGLSNQEIGERLFLALDTVKGHNRRIFDKLQVQRRTEAVARARELGLL